MLIWSDTKHMRCRSLLCVFYTIGNICPLRLLLIRHEWPCSSCSGTSLFLDSSRNQHDSSKQCKVVIGNQSLFLQSAPVLQRCFVLQIQCKLFVFDKNSQSWVERGRGLLRLNDMASTDDGTLQSRLGKRNRGRKVLGDCSSRGVHESSSYHFRLSLCCGNSEAVGPFLLTISPMYLFIFSYCHKCPSYTPHTHKIKLYLAARMSG